MASQLRLGEPVNLLDGLRPAWMDSSWGGEPFSPPPTQPFRILQVDVPADDPAEWGGPTLSLHDTLEDLVNEIFDYRVAPFSADPGPFRIPPSTLMFAGENGGRNLASLSALLGIDLARAGSSGFILLKTKRMVKSFAYPAGMGGIGVAIKVRDWWTPEGRNAMGRLRVAERIHEGTARDSIVTPRQSARYIDYFYNFGTHYVARATFGDCIVQVFACVPSRYGELKERLACEAGGTVVSGPLLDGLRSCTGSRWVSARGRIVAASGDPALTETSRAGAWLDDEIAGGDNLLAPLAGGAASLSRLCRRFTRTVPIAVEFFPQDPFMEVFRACAWRKVLKGSLLQKYFRDIVVPLGPRTAPGLSLAPGHASLPRGRHADGGVFPGPAGFRGP